ncbi:MAG: O-antigen ligase family protein [Clostridia bacterium]|nr:O-antigen ligase family protein [Clostridia bacterium]
MIEKLGNKVLKILDIVICSCIVILSIKKGGFYTKDTLWFNVSTIVISFIYFFIRLTISIKSKENKFDMRKNIIYVLVMLLPISYILPIMFNKISNVSDSFYEMIRYINFALLFITVSISLNKKYYINTLITVGIMQVFFGIDGIALRVFSGILNKFNSGYLNIDLDRLSATVQYANTTAIIFALALIIFVDKFIISISNINNKIIKSLFVNVLTYMAIFWLFSSIILTQSRAVLLVFSITFIIYTYINKQRLLNITYFAIPQVVLGLVYTSQINRYLLTDQISIYYLFISYSIIFAVIGLILIKNVRFLSKIEFNSKNIKLAIVLIVFFTVMYILIGLNISKPININSMSKVKYIERSIYKLKVNETNTINVSINEQEVDTRYYFTIYEEDVNHNLKYLTRFDYFNTTSGNFTYVFTPSKNAKKLNIKVECSKGSIVIESLKLNDKRYILDYAFFPSEYVFRVVDMLYGSTSTNDRIEYIKDSIKLISSSPLVGLGGEGFKNNYKNVQSVKYNSTEAHSSILQIFVESGIIGGIIILVIIIFTSISSKYSTLKLAYIMFAFHSIIDLNFSYMLLIVFLAILSSSIKYGKEIYY